jgi:hypothetical protein
MRARPKEGEKIRQLILPMCPPGKGSRQVEAEDRCVTRHTEMWAVEFGGCGVSPKSEHMGVSCLLRGKKVCFSIV